MKEKLQEYALIAEIVGAIGIIASLVFVGIQVSQNAEETALNTRSMQGSVYQDLIQQINAMNLARMENYQLAELLGRYSQGEEILIPGEINQMNAFFALAIRFGDLAFRQYQNGLIDEQGLNSILRPMQSFTSDRMGLEQWNALSDALNPDYVRYVNGLRTSE